MQEAKEHASEDAARKELIDARNAGDQLAYQAEKTLGELGDKVPDSDRDNIQAKVKELREVLEGDDIDQIKKLSEEVQQASYALSQQLYAQQSEEGQAEGATEGQPDGSEDGEEEGDVVEGEFREA